MPTMPLTFLRRGDLVALGNVPPDRTLLDVLREDLHCTGTKEGCGEGDCGACTVVVAEPHADGRAGVAWRAINSCIALAHSVQGKAVFTVEDIAPAGGGLHPAQEAMVSCHASQCGFCTPGFVMSLFGLYQQDATVTREAAQHALSGNLCRCTGYRPILDAAQAMSAAPRVAVDEVALAARLRDLPAPAASGESSRAASSVYLAPPDLQSLLAARAAHPQAQLVAGCTDVGLWITKMHQRFAQVLDVTRVAELRRIEPYENHIAVGAAVTLEDAYAALIAERPQLRSFAHRFAGLPVRNAGTLGGNVANGSPIGDSMPLLIALNAHVVLMSTRGHRQLPLEDFYTGYRRNVLAPDEVLAWVLVPRPAAGEFMRVYKISKRFEDDISAVCLALTVSLRDGVVERASIGAGGVAGTPVRARMTEDFLRGKPWSDDTIAQAAQVLRDEFQPITDMRASAAYRSAMLESLFLRFAAEQRGDATANLECFVLEDGA